jgi:hypothetical protein
MGNWFPHAMRWAILLALLLLAPVVHSAGQLYYLSRERLGGGLSLGYFASVVGGPPPTASEIRSIGATPTAAPTATPTAAPAPSASVNPSAVVLERARTLPWWA